MIKLTGQISKTSYKKQYLFIIISALAAVFLWAPVAKANSGVNINPILSLILSDNENATPGKSLYVGFYLEDAASNPEDPVGGSIYLNIPDEDGAFDGSMYFTYEGCQSSNIGTVSGTKSGNSLIGNWSGTVDGTSQMGAYSGAYNTTESRYSGTYNVSAGKQFISIEDCIEYFIAPYGTWFLYPQNTTKTFDGSIPNNCSVSNNVVSWFPPTGHVYSILNYVDKDLAESGSSSATVSQQVVFTSTSMQIPANLTAGKSYIVSVASFNESSEILYYCNVEFVK